MSAAVGDVRCLKRPKADPQPANGRIWTVQSGLSQPTTWMAFEQRRRNIHHSAVPRPAHPSRMYAAPGESLGQRRVYSVRADVSDQRGAVLDDTDVRRLHVFFYACNQTTASHQSDHPRPWCLFRCAIPGNRPPAAASAAAPSSIIVFAPCTQCVCVRTWLAS